MNESTAASWACGRRRFRLCSWSGDVHFVGFQKDVIFVVIVGYHAEGYDNQVSGAGKLVACGNARHPEAGSQKCAPRNRAWAGLLFFTDKKPRRNHSRFYIWSRLYLSLKSSRCLICRPRSLKFSGRNQACSALAWCGHSASTIEYQFTLLLRPFRTWHSRNVPS